MSDYPVDEEAPREREFAKKIKQVAKEARRRAIRDRELFKGLQIAPTASFENDSGGRRPGDTNWSGFGFDIHPRVTIISAFTLIVFILPTPMFQEDVSTFFKSAMAGITSTTGWFLILVGPLVASLIATL